MTKQTPDVLNPSEVSIKRHLDESVVTTPTGRLSRFELLPADLSDPVFQSPVPNYMNSSLGSMKLRVRLAILEVLRMKGMRKTDLARELDCRPQYIQRVLDLSRDESSLDKLLEIFEELGFEVEITMKPLAKNLYVN